MAGVKFAGHTDFFPHEVSPFSERVCLCPAGQHKRVIQPRNIQLGELLSLDESPVSRHNDLGRRKARVLDRFGNQDGIEGLSRFRKHLGLPLHQIHVGTTNAIQALQGLLGPFGSKASYHAVDFDGRLHHLGRYRHSVKKAYQYKQKPDALLYLSHDQTLQRS